MNCSKCVILKPLRDLLYWLQNSTGQLGSGSTRLRRAGPRSKASLNFDRLEPRKMLTTVSSMLDGYESETRYVKVELSTFSFWPTELEVQPVGGDAVLGEDYLVDSQIRMRRGQSKAIFPVKYLPDSTDEGTEEFQLSIVGHRVFRGFRKVVFETVVSGRIADQSVSISAPDDVASEMGPRGVEVDSAILRFSREGVGSRRPLTVYFVALGESGKPIVNPNGPSTDWQLDQGVRSVGFKRFFDFDQAGPGEITDTPVYAVEIPSGEMHVDVRLSARSDSQYENDQSVVFTLLDDLNGCDVDHGRVLYELGADRNARVTIVDRTADIDIGELNEAEEDGAGYLLLRNDDDDNLDGVPDYRTSDVADRRRFVDDDLVEVNISSLIPEDAKNLDYKFTLHFNATHLRFWFNQDKSKGPGGIAEITSETRLSVAEGNQTIWVEGIGMGVGKVELIWGTEELDTNWRRQRHPRIPVISFDSFKYSLLGTDLDVDSDNDGVVQHSDWEEELEDSRYGIGKLMEVGCCTQIDVQVPVIAMEKDSEVRFVFEYQISSEAGRIWLFKAYTDDVFDPQRKILPGVEYSWEELIGDPIQSLDKGYLTLFIFAAGEAKARNGLILDKLTELERLDPENTIKVRVMARGKEVSDEVKYIVANEDSIFWEINEKPEVRAALASRAVYTLQDLPHAGLEILDRGKEDRLRELGIPEELIRRVNRMDGDDDQLPHGFTAAVYKNYTSGPKSYLISFAGTNPDQLEDWINNLSQAATSGSPQYTAAMDLGLALRMADGVSELHATGHSLGGGLASAAVVWAGGIQGYTFNASGVKRDTIEMYQDSYNLNRGDGLRRDVRRRYDNLVKGSDEVIAFFNTLDILTVLQDSTENIPSALGQRRILRGEYAQNTRLNSDAFFAGSVLQYLISRAIKLDENDGAVVFDGQAFQLAFRKLIEHDFSPMEEGGMIHFTVDRIEDFTSGIVKLIDTHSFFVEALLGDLYEE